MFRKTIIAVVVMSMLLLSFGLVSAATQKKNVRGNVIKFKYVERITAGLSVSGGTARVSTDVVDVDGDSTSLSCTATLQKKSGSSWKTVSSWSKSTKSSIIDLYKTKSVSRGKYRVKNVVKAYKKSKVETVTKYSPTATY